MYAVTFPNLFFLSFPKVKPIINETKLPSTVSVFRGYPEVFVCEAEGNPKPEISWSDRNGNKLEAADGNLTVSEFEDGDFYTCSASNSVNTTTRQVYLDIKGKYAFCNHLSSTMFV